MCCDRAINRLVAQKDWIFLKKKCQECLLKRKIVVPLHSQHGQKLISEWMCVKKTGDCGIFVASESRRIYSYAERSRKSRSFEETAEIAQLVEHNLAKVGVASSSLVFRSFDECTRACLMPRWRNGRRARFRCEC